MKSFKELVETVIWNEKIPHRKEIPPIEDDNIPSSITQHDRIRVTKPKDLYWKKYDETGGNLTPEHLHNIITDGSKDDREMALFYHSNQLHPATSQHIATNGSLAERKIIVRENKNVHPDTLHNMLKDSDESLTCSIGCHPNARDETIKAALDKSTDEISKANILRNPNIKSETLEGYINKRTNNNSVSIHSAKMALHNKQEL